MREGRDFSGVVQQQWNNGRIIVAVDDESQPLQAEAEVPRIERQTLQTLFSLPWAELARDDAQRSADLRQHGWRGSFTEDHPGIRDADFVHEGPRTCNIAAVRAEGFRKRAHQDIDFVGRNAEVIADAPTSWAEGADAVCFVQVDGEFVLLLQRDEAGEVDHRALHAVQTFHYDEDFAPGAVGAGLALGDAFAEQAFQVRHVVMFEHVDDGA